MSEQEPERVTVPPVDDEPMRPESTGEQVPQDQQVMEPQPAGEGTAEDQPVVHGQPVVITPATEAGELGDVPEPVPADEPRTVTVQDQMAVSTEQSIAGDALMPHPNVLVRLRDVFLHLENFLARNPGLEAAAGADLRSGLNTLERVNDPVAQQAARDAVEPQPLPEQAPAEAEPEQVQA